MPLNAGKSGALVGLIFVSALGAAAQSAPAPTPAPTVVPLTTQAPAAPGTAPTNVSPAAPVTVLPPTSALPSAADIMRARVAKAKAYVAIKNYAAAIYELENIKRESKDAAASSVTQVMLMSCYLEQLDYKRAQSFLTEIFNQQKLNRPGTNYFAAAGQVVKSARNQLDRYKSLGLAVSDRSLPAEAVADVDRMREMLETVVAQSKTLGEDKKLTANAMVLLEEASGARSNLARDEYDARRWKDAAGDARDDLMNSRTAVINAVEDAAPAEINNGNTVAAAAAPPISAPTPQSVSASTVAPKPAPVSNPAPTAPAPNNSLVRKTVSSAPVNAEQSSARERRIEEPNRSTETSAVGTVQPTENKTETPVAASSAQTAPAAETVRDSSPLQVGSLVEYATEKTNPTYPPAARMMRKTGTVRVEVVVNEEGKIAEVKNASGESLLQRAALDALKKWRFKPFTRDGQPVKATGFVNFNFNL